MRNKRYILFLGLLAGVLCLATSCRPRGVLSSRQMRSLIIDLHKTEALLEVHQLHRGHDQAEDIYYAEVLERHGVTQAQFDSSLVWYTNHPQRFNKIYPKVLKALADETKAYTEAHADELQAPDPFERRKKRKGLSHEQLKLRMDSTLWVTQHGYPSSWQEGFNAGSYKSTPSTGLDLLQRDY